METHKIVLWELLLILASVLFFRSLWMLMDKYLVFPNEDLVLVISFVISVGISALAIYKLSHDK